MILQRKESTFLDQMANLLCVFLVLCSDGNLEALPFEKGAAERESGRGSEGEGWGEWMDVCSSTTISIGRSH